MKNFELLAQKLNPRTPMSTQDTHDLNAWMAANAPRGSGIDSGTRIDYTRSKPERIVLEVEFHHMDQYGYYCGWKTYSISVTPTLACGPIKIGFLAGRDRNGIKDHLADLYRDWLLQPAEWYWRDHEGNLCGNHPEAEWAKEEACPTQ